MEFFDEFYESMSAHAAPFMKLNKKIRIVALACLCVIAIQYISQKLLPLLKRILDNRKQLKNADSQCSYEEEKANCFLLNHGLHEIPIEESFQQIDYNKDKIFQTYKECQQYSDQSNILFNYGPRNAQHKIGIITNNQPNIKTESKQPLNQATDNHLDQNQRKNNPLSLNSLQINYQKPLPSKNYQHQQIFNQDNQFNASSHLKLEYERRQAEADRVNGTLPINQKPQPLFSYEERYKLDFKSMIGLNQHQRSQEQESQMDLENNNNHNQQNNILQNLPKIDLHEEKVDGNIKLDVEDKQIDETKQQIRPKNNNKIKQMSLKKDKKKKQRDNSAEKEEKQEKSIEKKKKLIKKIKKAKLDVKQSDNNIKQLDQNDETNSTNHSDMIQGNQVINQNMLNNQTQNEIINQNILNNQTQNEITQQQQQQQQNQQQLQNQLPQQHLLNGENPRQLPQESYQLNYNQNNNLSNNLSISNQQTDQKDVLPLPKLSTKWIMNKENMNKNSFPPAQFLTPSILPVDQFDHQDISISHKAEYNVYNEKLQKGYNVHVITNNKLLVRPEHDEDDNEQVDKNEAQSNQITESQLLSKQSIKNVDNNNQDISKESKNGEPIEQANYQ